MREQGAVRPRRAPVRSRRPGAGAVRVALDVLPLVGQPSGVGAGCRGLLGALLEREDVDVRAYAVTRKSFLVRRELPGSVRFHGRPLPTSLAQSLWAFSPLAPAELVTGPVDVVHGTNFSVPPSRRAATVVTVHDLTALRFPALVTASTQRYPALVKAAVERGAVVHVPSAFVAEEVCELLGADRSSVSVVHWGIPPVDEPTTPPPVEPPYVLAVGTVEPRKDHPTLVAAFAEMCARDDALRLVVAGSDGWGSEALTDAVAAHHLEDRVMRLGYVNEEERSALLWNAAVLAYPSLYEGFGFPPLEAMTAGVPVVATRAGAVPEVVGEAALLVEPGDRDGLAEALVAAMSEGAAREALILRGRGRAAEFSWERCGSEMMALYHEALARHLS